MKGIESFHLLWLRLAVSFQMIKVLPVVGMILVFSSSLASAQFGWVADGSRPKSSKENVFQGETFSGGLQGKRNVFEGEDFSNGVRSKKNVFGGQDYSNGIKSKANVFGGQDFSNGISSKKNVFGGYDFYEKGVRIGSSKQNVFGGQDYTWKSSASRKPEKGTKK